MGTYTVELSKEEEKAILVNVVSIQEWLENAVKNKARQCVDSIIEEHSNFQPKKLSSDEKLAFIRQVKVETAAERTARLEQEMQGT